MTTPRMSHEEVFGKVQSEWEEFIEEKEEKMR
jgi:hypothetical protein